MSHTATHEAVATMGPRLPLQLISVPTPIPKANEIRVRVEWTASTPLDLHQADGGLLVTPPQVLGDGTVGTIVEVGRNVRRFEVGDNVFGFAWRGQAEKAHQTFVVAEERLWAKVPEGFEAQSLVTVPNNFVTVFHTLTHDLGFALPWPKPAGYVPEHANSPILIWGGSSSVGQYALQVLKYYGYRNVIATASERHHAMLKSLGAKHSVDYRNSNITEMVVEAAGSETVKYVVDCIGSLEGSVKPIAQIVEKGTIVAIMLPVIVKDTTEEGGPVYEMDVRKGVDWKEGVEAKGVRTHFYMDNDFLAEKLQPEIMPALIASGDIKPNRYRVVEGKTLLERAENALQLLREKAPSGERLVWRVGNE